MRLDGVRVVDLHHLAKVHALHEFVNLLVVKVMGEDEQHLGNVPGLG